MSDLDKIVEAAREITPPRKADFPERLATAVAEWLIVGVGTTVVAGAWVATSRSLGLAAAWKEQFQDLSPSVMIGFVLLYYLPEAIRGTSLIKHVFADLRIGRADGAPAPSHRLLLRWAIKMIPLLFLALAEVFQRANRSLASPSPLLTYLRDLAQTAAAWAVWVFLAGCLLALLPSRRTLHDRLSGTAVFWSQTLLSHLPAFDVIVRKPK